MYHKRLSKLLYISFDSYVITNHKMYFLNIVGTVPFVAMFVGEKFLK